VDANIYKPSRFSKTWNVFSQNCSFTHGVKKGDLPTNQNSINWWKLTTPEMS